MGYARRAALMPIFSGEPLPIAPNDDKIPQEQDRHNRQVLDYLRRLTAKFDSETYGGGSGDPAQPAATELLVVGINAQTPLSHNSLLPIVWNKVYFKNPLYQLQSPGQKIKVVEAGMYLVEFAAFARLNNAADMVQGHIIYSDSENDIHYLKYGTSYSSIGSQLDGDSKYTTSSIIINALAPMDTTYPLSIALTVNGTSGGLLQVSGTRLSMVRLSKNNEGGPFEGDWTDPDFNNGDNVPRDGSVLQDDNVDWNDPVDWVT
jgi:hypothetical protein